MQGCIRVGHIWSAYTYKMYKYNLFAEEACWLAFHANFITWYYIHILAKYSTTCITLLFNLFNFRSTDMWGLGCLIWEVFNGSLSQISALKSVGKVWIKLLRIVKKIQFICFFLTLDFLWCLNCSDSISDSEILSAKLLWTGGSQPKVSSESCQIHRKL